MYSRSACYYHLGGTAVCRALCRVITHNTPLCVRGTIPYGDLQQHERTWRENRIPPQLPPPLRQRRPQQCGSRNFYKQCYHPVAISHPCRCAIVVILPRQCKSHPLLSHTPTTTPSASVRQCYHTLFMAPATCTLLPGPHKIPHPPQSTTRGDFLFFALQNFITWVCYLVSYTVWISRHVRNKYYHAVTTDGNVRTAWTLHLCCNGTYILRSERYITAHYKKDDYYCTMPYLIIPLWATQI